MFKTLSAALVAMSLVAIAQPALALANDKAPGSSQAAPAVTGAQAAEAAKAAAKAKAEADAKAKLSSENKSEEPAEQPKPSSEN